MAKLIHLATIVDENTSKKFDKIADAAHRSRADHLRFIIEKEIEFHDNKVDEK